MNHNAQDNLTPPKAAHTAGPWRTSRVKSPRYADDPASRGDMAIVDERDRILAECFERVASNENYPAEANAAFIVRACNSHEELLEALEETVSILERQGYKEYGNRWLREAHAAIEKAKGETA